MLDRSEGVKSDWAVAERVVVFVEKEGVERRAAKGVNKAGPERSGGVQLAETRKQKREKRKEKREKRKEKGMWMSSKMDDDRIERLR